MNNVPELNDAPRVLVTEALKGKYAYFAKCIKHERLNKVQTHALPMLLDQSKHVLLASPTGTGKTIAWLLAMMPHLHEPSTKILYLVPTKTLAKQKQEELSEMLDAIDFECAEITSETDAREILSARACRVVVATTEKWQSLLAREGQVHSYWLKTFGALILDEVHFVGGPRGMSIETTVSRMLSLRPTLRIIAGSATIPNAEDIQTWLCAGGRETSMMSLGDEWREVQLQIEVVAHDVESEQTETWKLPEDDLTRAYVIDARLRNVAIQYATMNVNKPDPVIFFVNTRAHTVSFMNAMIEAYYKALPIEYKHKPPEEIPKEKRLWTWKISSEEADEIEFQDEKIASPDAGGVLCLHAGMHPQDRKTVQKLFEAGAIKAMVATSIASSGINTSAVAVVIIHPTVYTDVGGARQAMPLGNIEVKQMIGRAGRVGRLPAGRPAVPKAIIITTPDRVKQYTDMELTDLESFMAGNLARFILGEMAARFIESVEDAQKAVSKTFYAVRARTVQQTYTMDKELTAMRPATWELSFIEDDSTDSYSDPGVCLDSLGNNLIPSDEEDEDFVPDAYAMQCDSTPSAEEEEGGTRDERNENLEEDKDSSERRSRLSTMDVDAIEAITTEEGPRVVHTRQELSTSGSPAIVADQGASSAPRLELQRRLQQRREQRVTSSAEEVSLDPAQANLKAILQAMIDRHWIQYQDGRMTLTVTGEIITRMSDYRGLPFSEMASFDVEPFVSGEDWSFVDLIKAAGRSLVFRNAVSSGWTFDEALRDDFSLINDADYLPGGMVEVSGDPKNIALTHFALLVLYLLNPTPNLNVSRDFREALKTKHPEFWLFRLARTFEYVLWESFLHQNGKLARDSLSLIVSSKAGVWMDWDKFRAEDALWATGMTEKEIQQILLAAEQGRFGHAPSHGELLELQPGQLRQFGIKYQKAKALLKRVKQIPYIDIKWQILEELEGQALYNLHVGIDFTNYEEIQACQDQNMKKWKEFCVLLTSRDNNDWCLLRRFRLLDMWQRDAGRGNIRHTYTTYEFVVPVPVTDPERCKGFEIYIACLDNVGCEQRAVIAFELGAQGRSDPDTSREISGESVGRQTEGIDRAAVRATARQVYQLTRRREYSDSEPEDEVSLGRDDDDNSSSNEEEEDVGERYLRVRPSQINESTALSNSRKFHVKSATASQRASI